MTENEAIKRVEEFGLHHAIGDLPYSTLTVKAFEMAIEALTEIQQYRKLGTVEECKKSANVRRQVTEIVNRQLIAGEDTYEEVYSCFWEIVRVIQDNY